MAYKRFGSVLDITLGLRRPCKALGLFLAFYPLYGFLEVSNINAVRMWASFEVRERVERKNEKKDFFAMNLQCIFEHLSQHQHYLILSNAKYEEQKGQDRERNAQCCEEISIF